jgi:hypothetical protein
MAGIFHYFWDIICHYVSNILSPYLGVRPFHYIPQIFNALFLFLLLIFHDSVWIFLFWSIFNLNNSLPFCIQSSTKTIHWSPHLNHLFHFCNCSFFSFIFPTKILQFSLQFLNKLTIVILKYLNAIYITWNPDGSIFILCFLCWFWSNFSFLYSWFFLGGRGVLGFWTQGLVLAGQVLFQLSHIPAAFCFSYFSGKTSHFYWYSTSDHVPPTCIAGMAEMCQHMPLVD